MSLWPRRRRKGRSGAFPSSRLQNQRAGPRLWKPGPLPQQNSPRGLLPLTPERGGRLAGRTRISRSGRETQARRRWPRNVRQAWNWRPVHALQSTLATDRRGLARRGLHAAPPDFAWGRSRTALGRGRHWRFNEADCVGEAVGEGRRGRRKARAMPMADRARPACQPPRAAKPRPRQANGAAERIARRYAGARWRRHGEPRPRRRSCRWPRADRLGRRRGRRRRA